MTHYYQRYNIKEDNTFKTLVLQHSNIVIKNEEENEEMDEGSYSDEDFLSEKDNNNNKYEKDNEKIIETSEFNKLYDKFIETERKHKNLEKEIMELSLYIKKIYMDKKINTKNIPNSEENGNIILNIVNKELELKDELINKLKEKTIKAELSELKNSSENEIKELNDFYTNNIKIINNALKKYNK